MKHGGYNVTNKIVGTGDFGSGWMQRHDGVLVNTAEAGCKAAGCGSAMRDVLSELGFVHLVENSIVAVQLSGGTQHCSGPIIWWDWKSSRE